MYTERAPFRNPYEKFTGTDLDSFVSSIREKVGNALKPPRRSIATGTSRDYDLSISVDDRSRISTNAYDDDARDETSSPVPHRNKGKSRALEQDLDEPFESYNEVSEAEQDQVLATLGGQAEVEVYSDGEVSAEEDVSRYKQYYDAGEDAEDEDEGDGAYPEGVEAQYADDEEDASEHDEARDSDRELSPDVVEHTEGGKDYNVDDDGAIVIDSDDEDGDDGGRLQAQRSPEWAVSEGFEEEAEEPEYQVEEGSDELREEEDLPGEYGLEPQYDDEEADELDEEQVSFYPVDRAEEFVDLETDIVHGEDDTFPTENEGVDDEDELELEREDEQLQDSTIEESALTLGESEMRQVAAELAASAPQPLYGPTTADFVQTNFPFHSQDFPSQLDPTVANALAALQQFTPNIPPPEQPFNTQEFHSQAQGYGHLDGVPQFGGYVPSYPSGVGVMSYPGLSTPSYILPDDDVIDVDALEDDGDGNNQSVGLEPSPPQECSNIWLANDESQVDLSREFTGYDAEHRPTLSDPLNGEIDHTAIYIEDQEGEDTVSIADPVDDSPSPPRELAPAVLSSAHAPATSVSAGPGDAMEEDITLGPAEGDNDLSMEELVGQAISSADALTGRKGGARTVDDVLRDFAGAAPIEAVDADSSMDLTEMTWEGVESVQEVVAPHAAAAQEPAQPVASDPEDTHLRDAVEEPTEDRGSPEINSGHLTQSIHDGTIHSLVNPARGIVDDAKDKVEDEVAAVQVDAASKFTELVDGVDSIAGSAHETLSTTLDTSAEYVTAAVAAAQEATLLAINTTNEAVDHALTVAHDASSAIAEAAGDSATSAVVDISGAVPNSVLAADGVREMASSTVGGVTEVASNAIASVRSVVGSAPHDAQEALTSVTAIAQYALASTQDQASGMVHATNEFITRLASDTDAELPATEDVIGGTYGVITSTREAVVSTSHSILQSVDEMANEAHQVGSPMTAEGREDVMSAVQAAREASSGVSKFVTAASDQTYEVLGDVAQTTSSFIGLSQASAITMVQESQDKGVEMMEVARDPFNPALTQPRDNTPPIITSVTGATSTIPSDLAAFIKDAVPPAADEKESTSTLSGPVQSAASNASDDSLHQAVPTSGPTKDKPRFLFPKPSFTNSDTVAIAEQSLSTSESQSDDGLEDPSSHMGNGLGGPGEADESDLTTSPSEDEEEAEDMASIENALKHSSQTSSITTGSSRSAAKGKRPARYSDADDQKDQAIGVSEENIGSAPQESDTEPGIKTRTRSHQASSSLTSLGNHEASDYDDVDGTDYASSLKDVSRTGHRPEGSSESSQPVADAMVEEPALVAPPPLPRQNPINLYTHHHGPLPPRVEVKVPEPEPDTKTDISLDSTTGTTAGARPRSNHNRTPSARDPNAAVTRSHCTFRKVSIPIRKIDHDIEGTADDQATTTAAGDDGVASGSNASAGDHVPSPSASQPTPNQPIQRTCFIVPGCALSAFDVVKDDDIEDLGEATKAENDSKMPDFSLAPIDPSVFAALHRLVGHDFMNDTACAWLPSPEERAAFDEVMEEYRQAEASHKSKSTPRFAESSLDTPASRRLGRKSTVSRYKVVLREGSSAGPSSSQQPRQKRHRKRSSAATNGTDRYDDSDYEDDKSSKVESTGLRPPSGNSPIPTLTFSAPTNDEDGEGSDVDGTSSLTRSASAAASTASTTRAPSKVPQPRSPRYSVRLGKRNADHPSVMDHDSHAEESDSGDDAGDRPIKRARRSIRTHSSTTTAKPLSLQKGPTNSSHAEEPSGSKGQDPEPAHWLRSTSTTPSTSTTTAKSLSPQKSPTNPSYADEPSSSKSQGSGSTHWLRSTSTAPNSSPGKGKKRGASELVSESRGKFSAPNSVASQSPRKRRRVGTGGKATSSRAGSVASADDDRHSVRSSASSRSAPRGDTVEVVIDTAGRKPKGRRSAAK